MEKAMGMSKIKAMENPREEGVDQEHPTDGSSLLLPGSDDHKSPPLLRTLFHVCQGIVSVPMLTPKGSSYPPVPDTHPGGWKCAGLVQLR